MKNNKKGRGKRRGVGMFFLLPILLSTVILSVHQTSIGQMHLMQKFFASIEKQRRYPFRPMCTRPVTMAAVLLLMMPFWMQLRLRLR